MGDEKNISRHSIGKASEPVPMETPPKPPPDPNAPQQSLEDKMKSVLDKAEAEKKPSVADDIDYIPRDMQRLVDRLDQITNPEQMSQAIRDLNRALEEKMSETGEPIPEETLQFITDLMPALIEKETRLRFFAGVESAAHYRPELKILSESDIHHIYDGVVYLKT